MRFYGSRMGRTLRSSLDFARMLQRSFVKCTRWTRQNALRAFRKTLNTRLQGTRWINRLSKRRGIKAQRRSRISGRKLRGRASARKENTMAEDKLNTGVDDVAKYENEHRRDTYSPEERGSGDPHLNWDDKPLSESETWKSHASRKSA